MVIAVLTLVVTTIGTYYTWRAYRQARVVAQERVRREIEITMGGDPVRHTYARSIASLAVSARKAANMRDARLVIQEPEKDPVAEVARWSLALFSAEDAERYEIEWNYHLYVLIEEGDPRQARRLRRRLAVRGILLAVEVRARRAFRRRGTH